MHTDRRKKKFKGDIYIFISQKTEAESFKSSLDTLTCSACESEIGMERSIAKIKTKKEKNNKNISRG